MRPRPKGLCSCVAGLPIANPTTPSIYTKKMGIRDRLFVPNNDIIKRRIVRLRKQESRNLAGEEDGDHGGKNEDIYMIILVSEGSET